MASYTAQLFESLRASSAATVAPASSPPRQATHLAAIQPRYATDPVPTLRATIHGSDVPVAVPASIPRPGEAVDADLPRDLAACHAIVKAQRAQLAQARLRMTAVEAQLEEVCTTARRSCVRHS